jgi:hypothetical protein
VNGGLSLWCALRDFYQGQQGLLCLSFSHMIGQLNALSELVQGATTRFRACEEEANSLRSQSVQLLANRLRVSSVRR